jgi:hypothetical protein
MRHDASEPAACEPGILVVVDGEIGVWRIERVLDDGQLRCFSYVDGRLRLVPRLLVRPCPAGIPAAPATDDDSANGDDDHDDHDDARGP